MAASLGGMGQAIYAAANAHMNSLAANCVAYRFTSPALMWNFVAELCMAIRLVAEISCVEHFEYLPFQAIPQSFDAALPASCRPLTSL